MKINITAKNMELTDAITKQVMEKIGSLEKLINNEETEAMVDVEVGKTTNHHQTGDIFRTEINLTIGGTFLRAEAVKDDLYASLDVAKDFMMAELRKHKNKSESMFRRGAAKIKNLLKGIDE
jgi:putative sigma-54 modulation protein